MAKNNQQNLDFNSINFVWFIWKWKWVIIVVAVAAVILSAIFSGPRFITPLYRSVVILFPSATSSISQAIMADMPGMSKDLMTFGEEAEAERMIQVLNSSKIRDRIVEKYDLMNHYEISPRSKYALTNLHKRYNSNIRFKRTDFKGVEIRVMDRSPDTAMMIASDIAAYFDTITNAIQKQRSMEGLAIIEAEYIQMQEDIRRDEDSLRKLREIGVHDYERQVEMINQQLAIEIARNNRAGIVALTAKLDTLAKYGGAYVSIRDALEHEKKNLSELRKAYKKAKIDATAIIPQKFVVDTAYKAEKKSYPIRWLIVAISLFSTVIMCIITLIIIENISRFRNIQSA